MKQLLSLVSAVLLVVSAAVGQVSPQAGVIDARDFDFTDSRFLISGTWIWFDGQLLTPDQARTATGAAVEFPGIWNERRKDESGQGVATYFVRLLVPSAKAELALEIPQIYSSYVLYVNGTEIARNGTPGINAESTIAEWRPQMVHLPLRRDTLDLTLQVANFSHAKGGVKEPIAIATSNTFLAKDLVAKAAKGAQVILLTLAALFFIVIFFRKGMKPVALFFSLMCITWSIRSLFSNDYIIMSLFPKLDWTFLVRVEYITLFLSMMWAILFLCDLFRNEASTIVKYVMVAVNLGYILYTVITPPIDFTALLPFYIGTAGIVLLYGAGVVMVALINERRGATYLTISVMLGLIIFSYDVFTYEGWFSYNSIVFSAGYVVIFFLMAGALLLHLNVVRNTSTATTMLRYEDLYDEEKK